MISVTVIHSAKTEGVRRVNSCYLFLFLKQTYTLLELFHGGDYYEYSKRLFYRETAKLESVLFLKLLLIWSLVEKLQLLSNGISMLSKQRISLKLRRLIKQIGKILSIGVHLDLIMICKSMPNNFSSSSLFSSFEFKAF